MNIGAKSFAEEVNSQDENLLTGRLSNMLVHFPGDKSLIGQIIPVSRRKKVLLYRFTGMVG